MTGRAEALSLIRTKLQRPRLTGDLIQRRRLLDRLHAGLDRKLTLISAQAGAGKSTLLAQWLADIECPPPSAWLSLDEHDNDLLVFVQYLVGAIQTVFPGACEDTLALLNTPHHPPFHVLTTSLVNDLDEACTAHAAQTALRGGKPSTPFKCLILALDDYQTITEPEIHRLVSALLQHLPQSVHLAHHLPLQRGDKRLVQLLPTGRKCLLTQLRSLHTPVLPGQDLGGQRTIFRE